MTSQPESSRWLKVGEVAERLETTKTMVYRLIRDGELPSVRLRNQVRVPERLLNDWIRQQEHEAVADTAYTARS